LKWNWTEERQVANARSAKNSVAITRNSACKAGQECSDFERAEEVAIRRGINIGIKRGMAFSASN